MSLPVALLALIISQASFAAGISGQLKSSTDHYSHRYGPPTEELIPYLSMDLTGKSKLSRAWRVQGKVTALGNLESKSAPEKFYADVPEGFLEFRHSDLRLRTGMNTLNWGVVDFASPADVTNTTALFHPLRTIKRGAPMLEAQWAAERLGLHLVYIPWQQAPLLPSADSRWLPRELLLNVSAYNTRILTPQFMEYEFLTPTSFDHALQDNFGARLNSHVGQFDFQALFFDGAGTSPKVKSYIDIDASKTDAYALSPVRLEPLYYRVQTSAAAATWAREKWIWRLETAYQHARTNHPTVQPWRWTSVLGAETNLDVGTTTMTWLAQFFYSKNPIVADNFISSSYRIFDRTLLLGTRWAASDDVTITVSGLYDFEELGLIFMAGFEQKLSDALKWGLSWRDFSARRDGLIRTFEKNDHANLDLTYYF